MQKSIGRKHVNQLQRGILKKILIAAFVFTCAACSSSPEKPEQTEPLSNSNKVTPQTLSADVYFEERGHSFKLKSDIYILGSQAVRLDLRTQLDLPLASLILTDKKLEYVLYRDKKYFSGKPGPHALDQIIPLEITASELVSVVTEKPLPSQKCELLEGKLSKCRSAAGPMSYTATWGKRENSSPWSGKATKLVIEIPSRKISLKFYFTDWNKKPSNTDRLYTLNIPSDFHK